MVIQEEGRNTGVALYKLDKVHCNDYSSAITIILYTSFLRVLPINTYPMGKTQLTIHVYKLLLK